MSQVLSHFLSMGFHLPKYVLVKQQAMLAFQDCHKTHYPSDLIPNTDPVSGPHVTLTTSKIPLSLFPSACEQRKDTGSRDIPTDQRPLIDHMELGTHSKISLPVPQLVKCG